MIAVKDILGPAEARKLAGGVTRATFQRWRESHGFPEPIKALESAELWDAAEVRDWLKGSADWRRKRRKPRGR